MKTSVVIPTYNSADFIESTVRAVLEQSLSPEEILVMDDGSTDQTVRLLRRYQPSITILQQTNRGVADARNALCRHARGDIIAFLDHDDIWHSDYLKVQHQSVTRFPNAAAYFSGHVTFYNETKPEWNKDEAFTEAPEELIPGDKFIWRYHQASGPFCSMSFCCVTKTALQRLGDQPFCAELAGGDDIDTLMRLSLIGPIVYQPRKVAAYRVFKGSQSANRVALFALWVRVLERFRKEHLPKAETSIQALYEKILASKRRQYARVLMGASQSERARSEIIRSMRDSLKPDSLCKSAGLYLATLLPRRLQPIWPESTRG
jgi:glycosyltransferase involved in cell wall biosynthesis